jgi:colanic acid/amylovoran biosynthesis glycosyltransferase
MPNSTTSRKQVAIQAKSQPAKVAYIVSAFPTVEETFVLYEMIEMEKLGVAVELYPLRRLRLKIEHPEADCWIKRAHYRPFLSLSVLRAQWRFLRRDWKTYFKTWAEVLSGTWGSADFFFGAIVIFPKAALFAQEMMHEGIAHIHAHFASHATVSALIIHRLTGIPFSFTARGTDIQVDRHMLKEKIEAAEFVIAVSSDNKKIMVDECGSLLGKKIRVIHGGVDVGRLVPSLKFSTTTNLRILCVARFEEVKGHTYLVEACKLLRERGVGFKCRLVGDGPFVPKIKKQIQQAELQDQVCLLGARAYPEVIQELRQADVAVLPTAPTADGKREGIPNVLKEAMATGLPVLASSVGGIPELVEHERTGILVPPRDSVALADALQRLSADKTLCERLGSAARDKVVREFNVRISTAKRAQLFLGTPDHGELPSSMIMNEHIESQAPAVQSA